CSEASGVKVPCLRACPPGRHSVTARFRTANAGSRPAWQRRRPDSPGSRGTHPPTGFSSTCPAPPRRRCAGRLGPRTFRVRLFPSGASSHAQRRGAQAGRLGQEERGQGREGETQQAPPVRRHPAAGTGRRSRVTRLLLGDEEARILVLGCRVKSGWATAVLVEGPPRAPRVLDRRVIDLSDARIPTSRQPYHAVRDARPSKAAKLERHLRRLVERITKQSLGALRRAVTDLGGARRGPWRADEKAATLAAWLALRVS